MTPAPPPDALVEAVARAMDGPYLPVPDGSPWSLDHLHAVKWSHLTHQEQGHARIKARALVAICRAHFAGLARDAVHDALSNGEGTFRERDMQRLWAAMLAAAPEPQP